MFIPALKKSPCLGTILTLASPDVAEVIALAGAGWMMVDLEHSTLSAADLKSFCQAAGGRCPVVARVPWNDVVWIKQAVDAGADGVIVPQINSAEEATRVVELVKYRPLGARGVGLGRAHGYGLHFKEYIAGANAAVAAIIQIEHIDGVEAIDSILAVPGLDGVFIGPYDLSDSLGLRGEVEHPKVAAAIARVKKACDAKGMPVGIFAGTAEAAQKRLNEGYRFLALGTDVAYLAEAVRGSFAALKTAEAA